VDEGVEFCAHAKQSAGENAGNVAVLMYPPYDTMGTLSRVWYSVANGCTATPPVELRRCDEKSDEPTTRGTCLRPLMASAIVF
jgi:hypothetical protein